MSPYIIAIVIAIIVIIVIAVICAMSNHRRSESLTSTECGLTGQITIPYAPLDRYAFTASKDSAGFAQLATVSSYPSYLPDRAPYLARRCDETPGCVAFALDGTLRSGILPTEAWRAGPGIYVRKCAAPETLYVELFDAKDFDTNAGRTLLPIGTYADLNTIASSPGVIIEGTAIKRNKASSMRVPVGLRATVYFHANFTGTEHTFTRGDYSSLSAVKCGIGTWNNNIVSIKVEYDPTTA
jgi:hypothetical protein